jgi:flagellar basal body-associated protein FliL
MEPRSQKIIAKGHVLLVIVLVLASAAIGGLVSSGFSSLSQVQAQRTTGASKPTAHRYEYQVYIAAGPKDLTDQANKLSEDGWELTSVITDERVVTRYVGFFKRAK